MGYVPHVLKLTDPVGYSLLLGSSEFSSTPRAITNFNTTLAPYEQCPNSNLANVGQLGNAKAAEWAAVYTSSIIKRLSGFLDGVNLTSSDIVAMQDMCAYEVRSRCF